MPVVGGGHGDAGVVAPHVLGDDVGGPVPPGDHAPGPGAHDFPTVSGSGGRATTKMTILHTGTPCWRPLASTSQGGTQAGDRALR